MLRWCGSETVIDCCMVRCLVRGPGIPATIPINVSLVARDNFFDANFVAALHANADQRIDAAVVKIVVNDAIVRANAAEIDPPMSIGTKATIRPDATSRDEELRTARKELQASLLIACDLAIREAKIDRVGILHLDPVQAIAENVAIVEVYTVNHTLRWRGYRHA